MATDLKKMVEDYELKEDGWQKRNKIIDILKTMATEIKANRKEIEKLKTGLANHKALHIAQMSQNTED